MKPSFSTAAAAVLVVASSAGAALAKNSSALPFAECMLPCDSATLEAIGCSPTDNLCHCEKATETFPILVPCVLSNSTCGSSAKADLLSFGEFAASTCVPFNLTIPAISDYFPNATAPSNTTTSSWPTPTPYVSAAREFAVTGVWAALAGVAGLALTL